MRINFKKLEQLARELGYSLDRHGREIRWKCNQTPDRSGVSFSISDATEDIKLDHQYRLEVRG
jgi:hypothetical protein